MRDVKKIKNVKQLSGLFSSVRKKTGKYMGVADTPRSLKIGWLMVFY